MSNPDDDLGKKIQQARKAEGYTQVEIADIAGIPHSTYRYLEQRGLTSYENLQLVLDCPRMKRYTLWAMTGLVAPNVGQISPELMKKLGGGKQLTDEELFELCEVEASSLKPIDLDKMQAELNEKVASVLNQYKWTLKAKLAKGDGE